MAQKQPNPPPPAGVTRPAAPAAPPKVLGTEPAPNHGASDDPTPKSAAVPNRGKPAAIPGKPTKEQRNARSTPNARR